MEGMGILGMWLVKRKKVKEKIIEFVELRKIIYSFFYDSLNKVNFIKLIGFFFIRNFVY